MAKEIERKFLLTNEIWRARVFSADRIAQGYLSDAPGRTVRVRVRGAKGYLTIKGRAVGIARDEFEYEIPFDDAEALLAMCPERIEKVRHLVKEGEHTFEIDEFSGENAGLIVAEVELETEGESFPRPDYLGLEVTADHRFANSSLAKNPYRNWSR